MSDGKEIIFVSGKYPLSEVCGGDLNYIRMWGRAAIAAGYSPQIVCVDRSAGEEETDFGRVHRVRTPFFRAGKRLRGGFRSQTILFHRGPLVRKAVELARGSSGECVLHGFGPWSTVAIAAARRLRREGRGCRCVVTFWSTVRHEVGAKTRGLSQGGYRLSTFLLQLWEEFSRICVQEHWEREVYLQSDVVLVNYDSVRRILETQWGGRESVRMVPYASEAAFVGGEDGGVQGSEKAVFPEGEAPLILAVSRHDPRKGLDVLIRALAILEKRGIEFRACLTSYGPLQAAHRDLVESLGLSERVSLPGFVRDLRACLNSADVFVLPSIEEGSGSLSVLEAMQAGKAIVASEIDGIPEDIVDGESGLLVRPGDEDSLAEKLEEVIGDAELRRRLGARAREVFEERFSPKVVIEAVRELYGTMS